MLGSGGDGAVGTNWIGADELEDAARDGTDLSSSPKLRRCLAKESSEQFVLSEIETLPDDVTGIWFRCLRLVLSLGDFGISILNGARSKEQEDEEPLLFLPIFGLFSLWGLFFVAALSMVAVTPTSD